MKIELELVISKNMHMVILGKLDVKSTTTQIRFKFLLMLLLSNLILKDFKLRLDPLDMC